MTPKNFLTELKGRNVYKGAIAPAAVAWLLIQVVETCDRKLIGA